MIITCRVNHDDGHKGTKQKRAWNYSCPYRDRYLSLLSAWKLSTVSMSIPICGETGCVMLKMELAATISSAWLMTITIMLQEYVLSLTLIVFLTFRNKGSHSASSATWRHQTLFPTFRRVTFPCQTHEFAELFGLCHQRSIDNGMAKMQHNYTSR